MLVEDEPHARQALETLLRDEGYTVAIAADGRAAREQLTGFEPDLVLSEVHLPGVDGLTLRRWSLAQDPARPVLLMSAYALNAEGIEVLSKPLDLDALLALLARLLSPRLR